MVLVFRAVRQEWEGQEGAADGGAATRDSTKCRDGRAEGEQKAGRRDEAQVSGELS